VSEAASLPSVAEQHAASASELTPFGGINLSSIRRDLSELLQAIRTNGFFEEYTMHDISHIDAMLAQLEWLIPAETQGIMTIADWLLIVLSAYFHDLGMLVTKDEYNRRESSTGYLAFREQTLNSQDAADQDFAARIKTLTGENLERFLYQEYVRQTHASRIRTWIEGRENELGTTGAAGDEVRRLLSPLDSVFKSDLAIVCESHHLDDLDDTNKYPVDRPYGPGPQEKANVQYAAIMLRTMDLLHITRDRTPSVAFRIINPQDPVSQREWARQQAVRSVRSKVAEDSEGNLDASLPRDTIEVHARYDNANDYFGLTSYLQYAEDQLRLSYDWMARSNKRLDVPDQFPWRRIDTSNIEAIGFLNRPFEFILDQDKILELLTGHTLYNDSSVVVRELVQNSLDAVRLAHGSEAESTGLIRINWDSARQVLEIVDNGIGMTQEIIERNFLRVGTSYYQEPQFQKQHPDFFPISRFGIGVLSTFMIADQVEVITCHAEEPKARRLELRTVHGKYLISLLDKTDSTVAGLLPHGTIVRLSLRPSAVIRDVIRLARHWIIIPGCRVEVSVDFKDAIQIGYKSTKEALEAALASIGTPVSESQTVDGSIRVIDGVSEGVSLAFAVRWSSSFKDWQFFSFSRQSDSPSIEPNVGTCAEGIRVESGSPGFVSGDSSQAPDRPLPLAIANIVGRNAPRTNVARSNFEFTDIYKDALSRIYDIYSSHLTTEMASIQDKRG
jgi:molecular chaperone HtpG